MESEPTFPFDFDQGDTNNAVKIGETYFSGINRTLSEGTKVTEFIAGDGEEAGQVIFRYIRSEKLFPEDPTNN